MAGREAHRAPGARRALARSHPRRRPPGRPPPVLRAARRAAPRAAMQHARAPPSPSWRSFPTKSPTAPASCRWPCPPSAAMPCPASRLCILWRHERLADASSPAHELLPQFSTSRDFALDCDAADILAPVSQAVRAAARRQRRAARSICAAIRSGLAPRAALDYVSEELAEWAQLGVARPSHRDAAVDRLRAELHQGTDSTSPARCRTKSSR